MSTDTEITRSLHEAAEHAAVPPLDLDALRAGGRRHARRRHVTVMAAAALVLAVVGGGVVLGPDALRSDAPPAVSQTPRTVADLPVGDAPALAYVVGERSGHLMGLRYGGGVTLGLDDRRGVIEVAPDGSRRVLDAHATGYPAVSPDGRWAAWPVSSDGADARIVLWSVESGKQSGVFTVPERSQCCDSGFHVAGVDNDGRVYVSGDKAHYFRDPGAAEPRVIGNLRAGDDEIKVGAHGVVVLRVPGEKGADGQARLFDVVDGRRDPTTVLSAPELAGSTWWSPYENDLFLSRGSSSGLRLWSLEGPREHRREKASQPVAVPADVEVTGVAWESPDAMLVDVVEGEDAHAWWLRCSMERRTCERAADLGSEGTVILPTR